MKKQMDLSAYTGRIRHIRERVLGLSGDKFGGLLGVSQDTVSTWERGIRRPKGNVLIKVAELGDCSVDWILTGKGRAAGGYPGKTFDALDSRNMGDRLAYLREKGLRLSRKELGARLDISEADILAYERAELVPSLSILKRFAEISGVSLGFIVSGTSKDKEVSASENRISELEKKVQALGELVERELGQRRESAGTEIPMSSPVQAMLGIPVLASLPAGHPITTTPTNVIDRLWVPRDVSIGTGNDLFSVRIEDESMVPELVPGDYVVVATQESAGNGDVIVCTVKGKPIVRQFDKSKGHVVLKSSNPEHLPITVTPADDFRVIGKVCAIGFRKLHRYTKPLSE